MESQWRLWARPERYDLAIFHWPGLSHRDTPNPKEARGTRPPVARRQRKCFSEHMVVSVSNYEDAEFSCHNNNIFRQHPSYPRVFLPLISGWSPWPSPFIRCDHVERAYSQICKLVRWVWTIAFLSITVQVYQIRILQIPKHGQKSRKDSKSLTSDSIKVVTRCLLV